MKKHLLLGITLALLAATGAYGSPSTETFNPNAAIPDGNPVGATFGGGVNDVPAGSLITGLTVGLNFSGGYDGDLYAYLVSPGGTQVLLLDRPGVTESTPLGNSDSGMNLTLQDGGTPIDADSDLVSGLSYAAAGILTDFNSQPANGMWTLYVADLANGGGSSVLNSWTLNITTVPEPENLALGMMAVSALVLNRRHRW